MAVFGMVAVLVLLRPQRAVDTGTVLHPVSTGPVIEIIRASERLEGRLKTTWQQNNRELLTDNDTLGSAL